MRLHILISEKKYLFVWLVSFFKIRQISICYVNNDFLINLLFY